VSAAVPVQDQLAAARAGGAVYERDGLGFVRVAGRDAARLLQNVVTSDIDALAVGTGQYGLALTPKGRPIADAWIVRESDDAFVCACESAAEDDLAAMLRRYRLASRVEIASVTGERALLERPHAAAGEGWHGGPLGALLLAIPEDARAAMESALAGGAIAIAADTRETLRIEQGVPRFGVDFDSSNLPAEVGIVERAVSFTKGCYVGQETVARLYYRGKPNRHLRGLRVSDGSGPLAVGAELVLGERLLGTITSVTVSPRFGPIGLALVRREAEPGATVSVSTGQAATVVSLPFSD
jgi:folate-binding protein YgfZ